MNAERIFVPAVFATGAIVGEIANKNHTGWLRMDEEVDPDIGRVVGFQTDDMMYIATIISIDDNADQFTVRTEDGQELTGPLDAVFLDPEKRMDELNERYEPLGGGKFREKPREAKSNWTPVADPSLRDVALTVGKIVGTILAIGIIFTVFMFGAILTQIDSGNWEEVQGTVVDAYEGQDCSSDSDGTTSCSSYTSVTVAYTYEGENYTTAHVPVALATSRAPTLTSPARCATFFPRRTTRPSATMRSPGRAAARKLVESCAVAHHSSTFREATSALPSAESSNIM